MDPQSALPAWKSSRQSVDVTDIRALNDAADMY
jgi:hypothetical protein